MSIDLLRIEVQGLCNYTIGYTHVGLSFENPASIVDNNILIFDGLREDDKIQAEAHELAHLYFKTVGLIYLNPQFGDECDFFVLELNNAISHKYVIEKLSELNISNDYHLSLRNNSLNNIAVDINNCRYSPALLRGLGLRIFDVFQTVREPIVNINECASQNEIVLQAYNTAQQNISLITPQQTREEQVALVSSFLRELGYRPDGFFR